MVDRLFSEPRLAELYDAFCGWDRRDDLAFYLPLVMEADSVLDVGCGTGLLLREARAAGHSGRLCGLDPAVAMLDIARRRTDVEWILGDVASADWHEEFDVVVMTGHAFQALVSDEEIRACLATVRAALAVGGRFVFETRNPKAREWEHWTPENAIHVTDQAGSPVRMAHHVHSVDGDVVDFTVTYSSPSWDAPEVSRSTLRFLDKDGLGSFLSDVGFAIAEQFGDWDRQPLTDSSPEIITIAHRA